MNTFNEFNFSDGLKNSIENLGFETPTEIQEKSINLILEGKDIIGESATGSGKTLAFGCGVVEKITPNQGLQALILTPTRELAEQIKQVLSQISSYKSLKILSIYGGVSINPQIQNLKKAEVVVATPGRFLDHLNRGTIDTSKINLLVLDEADRMVDMGFIDDVKKIINSCPKQRQTLCFSATVSSDINYLAQNEMNNPVRITAKKQVDPSKLEQVYYDVHRGIKFSLLLHLLKKEKSDLVMVFCNTRRSSDFVAKNLRANDVHAVAIHGGFSQNKRTNTMDMFNNGKANVLVCTDVAARGLDIDNVSHIYNFDLPRDPTDYVHRIGRTARAGETGKVINLLCREDHDNFSKILGKYDIFSIEKLEKPYVKRVNLKINSNNNRRRFKRRR